ncbi:hypothetical protein OS493_030526 [Desmophyllum pertusum]|uniref:Uncharacterized protein n=1 Tax=Desmophyllum pertusum TaxID=174260 RepID=A0A9X0CIN6_9CNID|nr:hypothetical protein OS493_030526 [Desmophyllum pertusum]
MPSDNLSHWSDVFMWRHHHYQAIVAAYESQAQHEPNPHDSQCTYRGTVSKRSGNKSNVIYRWPAAWANKSYKRSEDANKAFSQAVQMQDLTCEGLGAVGDYLDGLFVLERNMQLGVSAIVCYLHACRHQNEAKWPQVSGADHLADDGSISEAVDKYCVGVPPVHWLPWIPQLLTCLVRREGQKILNLALQHWSSSSSDKMEAAAAVITSQRSSTGSSNSTASTESQSNTPATVKTSTTGSETGQTSTVACVNRKQKCWFNARQFYNSQQAASSKTVTPTTPLTPTPTTPTTPVHVNTTAEQTAASTAGSATTTPSTTGTPQGTGPTPASSQSDPGAIRATAQMWRCSKIMHLLRELHPTLLSALEGVFDQMVWFRECWHEEVLRQLRQGLTKCYQVAFETRGDGN